MSFTLHVMLIILFNSLIVNELHSTQSLCGDIHVSYHTYFRNYREIQEITQNIPEKYMYIGFFTYFHICKSFKNKYTTM